MLGERKLASLTENREPRRFLDDAWNGGAVDWALEKGQWKFAMRTVMLDYSPSVESEFGFKRAFDLPSDHIRLCGVYSDESMACPLLQYRQRAQFIVCDLDTIYVEFVSNDQDYGNDLSLWPQTFVKFVEVHLASEVAMPLTQNRTKMEDMLTLRDKRMLPDALSKDAMQDPTRIPPSGSWVRARMWSGNYRRAGDR